MQEKTTLLWNIAKTYYSGLEFQRLTGFNHSNISLIRIKKFSLPYIFVRGKIKGLTLLEY